MFEGSFKVQLHRKSENMPGEKIAAQRFIVVHITYIPARTLSFAFQRSGEQKRTIGEMECCVYRRSLLIYNAHIALQHRTIAMYRLLFYVQCICFLTYSCDSF